MKEEKLKELGFTKESGSVIPKPGNIFRYSWVHSFYNIAYGGNQWFFHLKYEYWIHIEKIEDTINKFNEKKSEAIVSKKKSRQLDKELDIAVGLSYIKDRAKQTRISISEIKSAASKRGGYSKKQLQLLGIEYPPKKGWMQYISKCELEEHQIIAFKEFHRNQVLLNLE